MRLAGAGMMKERRERERALREAGPPGFQTPSHDAAGGPPGFEPAPQGGAPLGGLADPSGDTSSLLNTLFSKELQVREAACAHLLRGNLEVEACAGAISWLWRAPLWVHNSCDIRCSPP